MSSFTLIFPDEAEPREYFEIDFCFKFKLDFLKLKCGKFDPPIRFKNELVEIIHFTNFSFKDNLFIFNPNFIQLTLLKKIKIRFSVLNHPIPRPLPSILNYSLNDSKDDCLYHLFYKNPRSDHLKYLISSSCSWDIIFKNAQKSVIDSGFGTYGIKIGLLNNKKQSLEFFNEKEFYKIPENKRKRILIIAATSIKKLVFKYKNNFFTVDNVPRVARNFIYRSLDLMNSLAGRPIENLCRRLIYAGVNGGVPLNLLDLINSKLLLPKEFFASEDFERISLNFRKCDSFLENIEIELRIPIFNLKNHLLTSSSEATFRSLFWDVLINQLFYGSTTGQDVPKYRLESEWSTKTIYPRSDDRFVDFVALIKLNFTEIPILLIEVGKERFDLENTHKDFSKLLGMMSATCIKMAHDLVEHKKLPELARVYGIWIGGTQFQLCVAHPVITMTENGNYQIHANLTFCPHWKYDILSTDLENQTPLHCSCCAPLNCEGFEALIPGGRNDTQIIADTTIPLKNNEIDLEESVREIITEITEPLNSESLETEIESERENLIQSESSIISSDSTDKHSKLFKGVISIEALKKFKYFIECVKNRIDILNSAPTDFNFNNDKKFEKPDQHWIFVQSRTSSFDQTPEKQKFDYDTKETPSSPLNQVIFKKKKSKAELKIYWKLSIHDRIFAKVYEAELINDSEVSFEFEKMVPLVDVEEGFVCDEVYSDHFLQTLFKCTTFGIHCLYGLYLLHESVGIIHSDISPTNILFSPLHKIWKLNDFDQSLEIQKSLKNPRIAGTKGYVSPESSQSGIFTKASDVYSLGKVIQNVLYSILLSQFIEYNGKNQNTYEKLISLFEHSMNAMCANNLQERSTVINALKQFYHIIEISDFNIEFSDPILSNVEFILDLEAQKEENFEIMQEKIENLEITKESFKAEFKKSKLEIIDKNDVIIKNILQNK